MTADHTDLLGFVVRSPRDARIPFCVEDGQAVNAYVEPLVSLDLRSFFLQRASMKTAYELAMERLRKSDEAAGIETRPLTDQQKTEIAEVRNVYKAKVAQEEVMFESKLRASLDPAERDVLQQQLRRERERLTADQDAKIEKIRQKP